MESLIIRKADLIDLDTLLEFEQAIIEAERPFDPTIKSGPTNYYDIRELIESPEVELVVGEHDGRLIASGYAWVKKSEPYYTHSYHSYLGLMYVVPDYRGRGVNKLIVEALYDWSRKRGVNEVRLEVYSDNAAGIRAYEKAGFISNLVTMRVHLD